MAISNRYDFVALIDVENGNPNGDPDAGTSPRIDPETGVGFITDVCLKRKIRNYVETVKEGEAGFNILVKPDKSLNSRFTEAYDACGLEKKQKGKKSDDVLIARNYMCKNYFDVRAFGAVMSTGDDPCGIVRGPVQLNFARSVSPVEELEVTITRQARTSEDRMETGTTEMGHKSVIPYALYRVEGYVSACLAQKVTGLTDEDVELIWQAFINMFDLDHSATRGKMCTRKLYVFQHETELGNAPSNILFDKITVTEKRPDTPPRSFSDYAVNVDATMPEGVKLIEKL